MFIKHAACPEAKLKEAARIIAIKWTKVRLNDTQKNSFTSPCRPYKEAAQAIIDDNTAYEFSKHFEDVFGHVFEYSKMSSTQQMETTIGT